MKELGEYLKEQREINGINLDEAADDLSISVMELENIEAGNTRAFKDIYNLRDMIKKYAKYLGLDVKKVALEFNDFLFEHTSKISIEDIMAYKNDGLLVIANKFGAASADAKCMLYETYDRLRDLTVSGSASSGTGFEAAGGFLYQLARRLDRLRPSLCRY